MQLKWLRPALADLDEILTSIAADNREKAFAVAGEIVRQMRTLEDQPAFGRRGRVPGTRELVIGGPPYIVPYRVRKGKVLVRDLALGFWLGNRVHVDVKDRRSFSPSTVLVG